MGEPVAVVVADDRYQAEDALPLVEIDLTAAGGIGLQGGREADAPRAHLDMETNIASAYDQ